MRNQVLACFKQLHRTCKTVFEGDQEMLQAARVKINEEFHKNKAVRNPEALQEFINYGNQVQTVLKTTVVQARLKSDAQQPVYELKVTKDTVRLENTPYQELKPCAGTGS